MNRVRSTVEQLAKDHDGHAPRDAVIDELEDSLGDRDPEHFIETALKKGEFYETEAGCIAPA